LLRYTVGELVKRGIGIIAHALHHSLVADLHASAYGPAPNGRFEFINVDGTLRAEHETLNEFANSP
jgi:hypothetical protein